MMIEARRPCAEPRDRGMLFFPQLGFLFCSEKRIFGSGHNRNISPIDQFEHAERVGYFRPEPLVASRNGYSQNFRLWGLNEQKRGLKVGAGWTGGVLVDDDP